MHGMQCCAQRAAKKYGQTPPTKFQFHQYITRTSYYSLPTPEGPQNTTGLGSCSVMVGGIYLVGCKQQATNETSNDLGQKLWSRLGFFILVMRPRFRKSPAGTVTQKPPQRENSNTHVMCSKKSQERTYFQEGTKYQEVLVAIIAGPASQSSSSIIGKEG